MAIFSFWRKPVKLLLYGTLLALLCAASLIFFLQYRMDRAAMRESLKNYSYFGMAYLDQRGEGYLMALPDAAEELLLSADTVRSIHVMGSYAAKLIDGNTVPNTMMSMDFLQQRFFIQAELTMEYPCSNAKDEIQCTQYTLKNVQQWGGNNVGTRGPKLKMIYLLGEKPCEEGQEIFFTSKYQVDGYGVDVNSFTIYSPAAYEAIYGEAASSPLALGAYYLLKEGEGEAEILRFMEESGLLPYYERYVQVTNAATVRTMVDQYELPNGINNRFYISYGRGLTEEDLGKKVCLISQNLMLRNRYSVGDTITLSIADEAYTLENGWQSGMPMVDEALLTSYGPEETYEIVGIYHQLGRQTSDPRYYTDNDIFIPGDEPTDTLPLPYAFSFRVEGPNYEAFQTEVLPALQALGCTARLVNAGWEDVEDTYYAMELRSQFMFWCSVLTFVAAAVAFCLLLHNHLRREYGLQRLQGAYRREARRVYYAAIATLALPALVIAAVAGQTLFRLLVKKGGTAEAGLAVALLPAALLLVICVALPLMTVLSERGSLRKTIM